MVLFLIRIQCEVLHSTTNEFPILIYTQLVLRGMVFKTILFAYSCIDSAATYVATSGLSPTVKLE